MSESLTLTGPDAVKLQAGQTIIVTHYTHSTRTVQVTVRPAE